MIHSSNFVRNDGNDSIVCLHSSFSASKVWNDLMLHLSSNHPMNAETASFCSGVELVSDNNADLLEVQSRELIDGINRQTNRVHLIAHSFGASIALKVAQKRPENLASVVLIEPMAVHLLRQSNQKDNHSYLQVCEMSADLCAAVRRGDYWDGAKQFVDGWSGKEVWHQFDSQRKLELANAFERIPGELWSSMINRSTFADLDQINVPTLILCGTASPEPFRRVSCLLNESIESARHRTIGHAGHFPLFTHPFEIAKHIGHHFESVAATRSHDFDNEAVLNHQQAV